MMPSTSHGRQVIGRQPETIFVTPSKPNPWHGTIVEGRDITTQQNRALVEDHGLSAAVETIEVVREATHREAYWPTGTLPPVYVFRCPVLRRRADGEIEVVAPNGTTKRVRADGWAHKPSTTPKRAW